MPEWIPMFAMPNVIPQHPIEVDGIAFVAAFDDRIKALRVKYPKYDEYLNQFTDEFGTKINPSTIMVRDNAPEIYKRVDALASYRDAISIACVSKTWSNILVFGPYMDGPKYSNTFNFYPWLLDKNYDKVGMRSLAVFGVNELAKMQGQSAPGVSISRLIHTHIDDALLTELLSRWVRRYASDKPYWKDRALFRSLNMANAASNLPVHAEMTQYDIGRLVALWVSAFEILAHPPYGKNNGWKQVYTLLNSINWKNSRCKEKRFIPYPHKRGMRSNLPVWIYGQLNQYRNDFLHGNKVRDDHMVTKRSQRAIQSYASVLYRMALAAFLDLKWKEKPPKAAAMQIAYGQRQFAFESHQRDAESALGSICFTADEWNNLRNGQLLPNIKRWP